MRASRFPLVLAACAPAALQAAPWVVITEIHYHAPEGEAEEFIEVLNTDPPRADLSGWRLEGEAEFTFGDGAVLKAGERLVVARDPEAFRAAHPGVPRVLGPLARPLGKKGGSIVLRSAAGARACEARYGTRGKWPAQADGAGHSLSILDPSFDARDPGSWAPSPRAGGTPGAPNFSPGAARGTLLVPPNALLRYTAGDKAPDSRWRGIDFDDSAWKSGPGGLGFGDRDDATVIEGMQGRYVTVYARHAFEVPDPESRGRLLLRIDYDDGFIAYLNGVEAARANMGPKGRPAAHDEKADSSHEAGVPEEFDLGAAARWLQPGKNVLSVEVHNDGIISNDLTLIAELEYGAPAPGAGRARPVLNEARGAANPFVEVYNAGATEADLGGWFLTDDPRALTKLRLPSPLRLAPRGFAVLGKKQLGTAIRLEGPSLFLALVEPGGDRVADAIRLEAKGGGLETAGRFPDGSADIAALAEASPGAPNRAPAVVDVVVNEVLYRSPSGREEDEFIELHNRGASAVDLSGFRLTGAVKFPFPGGASLAAGGYVAVAKSPDALVRAYDLAGGAVLGPYEGSLSGSGEEIVLRDASGSVADRVAYGDRDPWPVWADGLGSSLELIDPALDNAIPAAWAASDASARSTWEQFEVTKPHREFQGQSYSELQFLLLGEGECLIDDVTLSGVFEDTFDGGAAAWHPIGNHERSGAVNEPGGNACFRITSDGRGNSRQNFVARELPRDLVPGRKYTLRFRARWLRGVPLLLTRTPGQGLARVHRLAVPSRLGTPAAPNSARVRSAPPVVGPPSQEPVLPRPGETVRVEARISSTSPIREAWIHHRRDEGGTWTRSPLAQAEGGAWSGTFPGWPRGVVRYYVSAKDALGKEGTFPAGAPERSALVAFGVKASKRFPTLTLIATADVLQSLYDRPRMSNRLVEGTLVFGDSRIFQNVRFRPRGSPFTRSSHNWRVVFGEETLDGRPTLTLDGQGGDAARPGERLTYWLIDQLRAPSSRQRYVHFRILGREEGTFEDVEKVDRSYLESWFGLRGGAPRLHKVDDYWEIPWSGEQQYREADFDYTGEDPEDYRWNFPERANGADESCDSLVSLVRLLDPGSTPNAEFDAEAAKSIDLDEWTRVLAARTLVDDWDTMGMRRGKNAFLCLPPGDPRWRLLPWDCDLAWRNPNAPIFSGKFAGIQRLLGRPEWRRRYLGYLSYLATRKFDSAVFGETLADLREATGASVDSFAWFAEARRDNVARRIPRRELMVAGVTREERVDVPDVARVTGTAPVQAMRFVLEGREGTARLEGETDFTAELAVGPEGGRLVFQALDFGGYEVGRAEVDVPARPGAKVIARAGPTPARALPTQVEEVRDSPAGRANRPAQPAATPRILRSRAGAPGRGAPWRWAIAVTAAAFVASCVILLRRARRMKP